MNKMNLKNYWISKLIIILGIFFLSSANADIKIKASQQVSNFLNTIKEFASEKDNLISLQNLNFKEDKFFSLEKLSIKTKKEDKLNNDFSLLFKKKKITDLAPSQQRAPFLRFEMPQSLDDLERMVGTFHIRYKAKGSAANRWATDRPAELTHLKVALLGEEYICDVSDSLQVVSCVPVAEYDWTQAGTQTMTDAQLQSDTILPRHPRTSSTLSLASA